MDLELDSVPRIEFRRSHISGYPQPMALGTGTNHNYNSWLYSDGESKLSFVDIIHEDSHASLLWTFHLSEFQACEA